MPRKVSILDRIALAEALNLLASPHGLYSQIFPTFLKLSGKEVPAGEEGKLLGRRASLRKRRPILTWFLFCATLVYLAVVIFVLSQSQQQIATAITTVVYLVAFSWSVFLNNRKPIEDRRIAGVRYVREFPVRRVLRLTPLASADPHAPSSKTSQATLDEAIVSCAAVLDARNSHWQKVPKKQRILDFKIPYTPRQAALQILIGAVMCVFFLSNFTRGLFSGGLLSFARIAMLYLAIGFLFTSRRTGQNADAARLRGCCPDCDFSLAGLERPLPLRTLTHEGRPLDIGPALCPECGTHWPLIPPPTPAELLGHRES
jgi:hypothetical protein